MITVFVGFWYWGQILVAPDAQRMGVGAGSTIGLFLLIWIVASMLLFLVTVVAWIVLMVFAYQGKRFEVPVAAGIAKSIAGNPSL